MREVKLNQLVYKGTQTIKATFTANATTDICTSNSHGLTEGDKVQLTTTGTLPAGLSTATSYYVISVTTNTFQLATNPGGSAINITDTGSGTHSFNLKGRAIYVGDWKYVAISLAFIGTSTMTVKFQAAITDTDGCPDFACEQSYTNLWDYIDVTDIQSESSVDGDTGVAVSAGADYRLFRLNTNGISWICADVTAFTAGNVEIRVSAYQ